jgi:hypothetical protein
MVVLRGSCDLRVTPAVPSAADAGVSRLRFPPTAPALCGSQGPAYRPAAADPSRALQASGVGISGQLSAGQPRVAKGLPIQRVSSLSREASNVRSSAKILLRARRRARDSNPQALAGNGFQVMRRASCVFLPEPAFACLCESTMPLLPK